MTLFRFALAAVLLLGVSNAALAAPLNITGTTTVELDATTVATLTAANVSVSPLGTASLVGLTATFPITGGDLTDGNTQVFHDGSGLRFTRNGFSLDVTNFVINLPQNTITANGDDEFVLFTLTPAPPQYTVTLAADGADAFVDVLGLPNLTGATIGTATPDIRQVAEPSSLLLLGSALALAARRLRKS